MAIRVGINGVGRIGKLIFRLLASSDKFDLVVVNDPMPAEILETLLKYDSIHGRFANVELIDNDRFKINNKEVVLTHHLSPDLIPWHQYNVDCVIEASGKFKTRTSLEKHIASGAKRVLLSQPGDDELDKTIVIGVNDTILNNNDQIISNASCTSNCLAPMIKVLDDSFGLQKAFFNTVHPFTNNQSLMDGPHPDPRRSRSAFCNIIPTTSTAVAALKKVMPHMRDRVDGFATRVPVPLGSYIEVSAIINQNVSISEINTAYRTASQNYPAGILEYCTDPVVSSDIIGNPHSTIFDSLCTKVIGGNFVQVLAWYDNETAYAHRIVDLLAYWYQVK